MTDFLLASDLDPASILNRLRAAADAVTGAVRGGDGGSLIEAMQSQRQREILGRLTAVMTLVEGHGDYVMDAVGPAVVPSVEQIRAKFNARRTSGNRVEQAIRRILGIDLKMRQYQQGAAFVHAVVAEAGMETFNRVWTSPETLPTKDELASPQRWLERVAGPGAAGSGCQSGQGRTSRDWTTRASRPARPPWAPIRRWRRPGSESAAAWPASSRAALVLAACSGGAGLAGHVGGAGLRGAQARPARGRRHRRSRAPARLGRAGRAGRRHAAQAGPRSGPLPAGSGSRPRRGGLLSRARRPRPGRRDTRRSRRPPWNAGRRRSCSATRWTTRRRPCCSAWPAAQARGRWPGCDAASGRYLRPLLGLRRGQTGAACAALGLEPWEDPQNADPAYARTRVRQQVLPVMEELLGPGITEALARTADRLRADADALDALADEAAGV